MKIICKIKDYYDYLSGIYGIDEQIVYDRRSYILFEHPMFIKGSELDRLSFFYKKEEYYALEVGFSQYLFKVTRNGEFAKWELLKRFTVGRKIADTPIALIEVSYMCFRGNDKIKYGETYKNPILKDTWIPSFIPAQEIYDKIYDYISVTNEPNINDNRTDIQKLESKGFDKKSSFRHPIK